MEIQEFIFNSMFPSVDEISECLQCLTKSRFMDIKLITPKGDVLISKNWYSFYDISFPLNPNPYIAKRNTTEKTLAKIISRDIDKLSWMDFHYVSPSPFVGDTPRTLDELCVFYQNLRMKSRVSQMEKDYVLERFAELIFEEAHRLSSILEMPFTSLHLHRGGLRIIASTDCYGHITFNSRFLFYDADSIREILVHELCHSESRGHSKRFNEVMEKSLLKCNLISRPCACSPNLSARSGASFPIGKCCPGYNFLKGLKGESCMSDYLGKKSLWIKNT